MQKWEAEEDVGRSARQMRERAIMTEIGRASCRERV